MPLSRRLSICCFATLLSTAVLAQEEHEEMFFSQLPVVFTVSRMPQPISEAPGAVTVLDREIIRASGARSVAELLRLVPGFQFSPRTNEPARTSYHGIPDDSFASRAQVLVDGRSLYSALFMGGVNWDLMPVALEDIERIEVMRGTNVAAYGTNAFMGVINIVTLDPSLARGTSISISQGNDGIRDRLLRWGGKLGNADVRMTYQMQGDDGVRFVPLNSGEPGHVANDIRNQLFNLRATLPLGHSDELDFSLGHVGGDISQGRSDQGDSPPRTATHATQYVQFNWRRQLSERSELRLRYSRTRERLDDHVNSTVRVTSPVTVDLLLDQEMGGEATRDELEIQHAFSPIASTRLVWGLGTRSDETRAPLYFQAVAKREVQRLFAHLEWRPARQWLVNLGGSLDRDSLTGSDFSSRFSASYHLTPEHTLRLGLARAYRIPSIYHHQGLLSYSGTNGNVTLTRRLFLASGEVDPEQLTSLELGYYGEFKRLSASLDVRLFDERIPNRVARLGKNFAPLATCEYVIVAPSLSGTCGTGADYAANAESLRINGLEYQARWQPLEGTRVILNQSWVKLRSHLLDVETSYSPSDKDRILDQTRVSAPRLSSSLMLMQKLPYGVELTVSSNHVGRMRWNRNYPGNQNTLPSYVRTDVRLARAFRLGGNRAEVAYVGQAVDGGHLAHTYSWLFEPRHWLTLRLEM